MNTRKEIAVKIQEIRKSTGIKINSYRVMNRGAENLIIEVDYKWIFRFPRNNVLRENAEKRLNFLTSFSKISPLKVPKPIYIGNSFIGYKKISGKPFHPTNLKKLTTKERTKIANQLGAFLKALHSYKDKHINFDTGYLVMRKEDYKTCPKAIAKYLNSRERKALETKLEAIGNNPLNFQQPLTTIHGDLNFNNILWDSKKKTITGVIDWGELGRGVPAMDFIMLADFNTSANDAFLKDILKYYGTRGEGIFVQIKENAIIDVMNWFWSYFKTNNAKGMGRMIKKLKKILA